MTQERMEMEQRLASLRSGSVKPVSREEKESVDREARVVGRCVVNRQRIVREMWGMIADSVPKEQWADLREDLGIDF
jgi:hypothetical protein